MGDLRTILVSDGTEAASAASRLLVPLSSRHEQVQTEEDAVRWVAKMPFDVVVFPERLGRQFCESIRDARVGPPPVLIVVVSHETRALDALLSESFVDTYVVGYDDPRLTSVIRTTGRLMRETREREAEIESMTDAAQASGLRYFRTDLSPGLCVTDATDVSDRARRLRSTEEALRQSENDYRRLFDGAHDAIVIFRPDTEKILSVNRRACELYGRTREDLIGRSLVGLSVDPDTGRKRIEETLEQGTFTNFRTLQRKADGTIIHIDINASVVDYQGEPAIVSINRDVTELVEAEEQIRMHREHLERAAALEAVGLVTSGVAHDFNNLLCVIAMCAETLDTMNLGTHANEVISDIASATVRGGRLARQIMTTLAPGGSPQSVVDLSEVVSGMERLLSYLTQGSIRIELDVANDLPPLFADPTRIEQLILNLVLNARDAIGTHGTIKIRTHSVSLVSGRVIVLSVSDDGCGMSAATQQHALEPFFTTKGSSGNGLGLPVVATIVRELAGEVSIESAPNVGTTITVMFPEQAFDHARESSASSSG